jgi:hypothetical protein
LTPVISDTYSLTNEYDNPGLANLKLFHFYNTRDATGRYRARQQKMSRMAYSKSSPQEVKGTMGGPVQ